MFVKHYKTQHTTSLKSKHTCMKLNLLYLTEYICFKIPIVWSKITDLDTKKEKLIVNHQYTSASLDTYKSWSKNILQLKTICFTTLWISIKNRWNKDYLRVEWFIEDSRKAIFRTLDDSWGGGRTLFKIAAKQCLGCLMDDTWWHLVMLDDAWWH